MCTACSGNLLSSAVAWAIAFSHASPPCGDACCLSSHCPFSSRIRCGSRNSHSASARPVCTCVKSHCECLRSPSRAWLVLTATDSSGGHRTRDAQVICVVTSRKAEREQDDSTLSSSISIAPAVFTPPALRHCMEGAERRLSSRVSQSRASSVAPCTPSLLPPCLNVVGQLSALHAVA